MDPVEAELALQDALIAFEAGRHAEALVAFQQLRATGPVAEYYLGLTLLRLDRAEEAARHLTAVRRQRGVPASVDLDLSVALIESGRRDEGTAMLREYAAANPEDTFAQGQLAQAERRTDVVPIPPNVPAGSTSPRTAFIQPGRDVPCDASDELRRRWNLTALTGYQYDSNIVLSPEFSGLGSNIQKDSSSWVNAVFGDYRLIQDEETTVGVLGSANHAAQFDLTQFSTTEFVAGAYANRLVDVVLLGTNYQFHETLLEGNHFAGEHRLVANASLLEGEFGHTTPYYEYDHVDIDAPALIPQQERSGYVNGFGITQAVYLLGGAGRLFGGYQYRVTNADGSDFDFDSHMVTGRIETPLGKKETMFADLIGDAEVRYFFDRYDNANSLDFFGRNRSDDRVEVRTGLQKYLTDHLSTRVDYTFVNSDSNVANLFDVHFYSYDRHIVTTQLIYDF